MTATCQCDSVLFICRFAVRMWSKRTSCYVIYVHMHASGGFYYWPITKKKIPINPFNACCNRYTYSFDRKELSVSPCRIVEFSSPSLEVIVSRQH